MQQQTHKKQTLKQPCLVNGDNELLAVSPAFSYAEEVHVQRKIV